ncbi:hypothetical protein HOI26_02315 [Candidatus Woesearchaeota archaeon]|nr:hypothetical protein [Candidatus Woesearchaeota archaeon]
MKKRLVYAGAFVLGLNDALVELTGMLAGLTLALQNTKLIALTGLVAGIAASLSMAASSYLSSKEDGHHGKEPGKAALYTGIAYIITVLLLVFPFFLFSVAAAAFGVSLSIAVLIIGAYCKYMSNIKKTSFWRRFGLMITISFGVALISFFVGWILRQVIGVGV